MVVGQMSRAGKERNERLAARMERMASGGRQFRLDAPQEDGMHRRWVNDDGQGSLERAYSELGYDFVTRDGDTADQRTDTPDTRISRHVGNGERAYLMQMPQEDFDAIQAKKQEAIDRKEDGIFRRQQIAGELSEESTGYVKTAKIRRGS